MFFGSFSRLGWFASATLPGQSEPAVPPAGAPVFRLKNVFKSYSTPSGSKSVLRGVTADIGTGLTCILGPSGHGKTTLLNILGALTPQDDGLVELWGEPLPTSERELRFLRSQEIGWVFQAGNLIGHLNAERNVALPLLLRGEPASRALEAARTALACVQLGDRGDEMPRHLSGGEMQRVAIARALASRARVVLADEPTGSLDPETAETVMTAFKQLAAQKETPVVMVTHNEALTRKYADRIFHCTCGKLTPEAKPSPAPAASIVLPPIRPSVLPAGRPTVTPASPALVRPLNKTIYSHKFKKGRS